jgi:hypothetical protein
MPAAFGTSRWFLEQFHGCDDTFDNIVGLRLTGN